MALALVPGCPFQERVCNRDRRITFQMPTSLPISVPGLRSIRSDPSVAALGSAEDLLRAVSDGCESGRVVGKLEAKYPGAMASQKMSYSRRLS